MTRESFKKTAGQAKTEMSVHKEGFVLINYYKLS